VEAVTWIRLRQVALVAHDLESVVEQLSTTLGLRVAHRDPNLAEFGLCNAVLPLGTQFVEVVSPIRAGTAAGRYLERIGGDGGYMVIGHVGPSVTDHERLRSHVDAVGVRVALSRTTRDGYRLLQLHPADTAGSFLELDFQPGGEDPHGPWMPAGTDWQHAARTDIVSSIASVQLSVAAPDAVANRWAELSQRELTDVGLIWDNATITFTRGHGGLTAIECIGKMRGTYTIGGVEFRVRELTADETADPNLP
jgi:hypothetical protein